MALEGLRVVLDKEPVVGTPTADRLLEAPEMMDQSFTRHVRSYVPFGRASGSTEDEVSISEYEQRLITLVKNAAAPKGYITADFGYGKTSTALYMWQRCRQANLLAVPPFQLGELSDLIRATYGWARYELSRSVPGCVGELEQIYHAATDRSIESDAGGDAVMLERLRQLFAEGRYTLKLTSKDYLEFFSRVSALAQQAGFDGLVLFPDEVQQYVEPSIKAGREDPIAPLHNIVEGMVTRKGVLKVGLIFSIPSKELGVINDQRGDLVQRLKMDRLALDLRSIYDRHFAARLWQQLAREFDFEAEEQRVVTAEGLASLGEIAARDDLASGPRTVIAGFKHMAQRYLDCPQVEPLGPVGVVDGFLQNEIAFDGDGKLQQVVQGHLGDPAAAALPRGRELVKLLGAFPTYGASEDVLHAAGLWREADELIRLRRGEVVIELGGGRDDQGNPVPRGYTLLGLEPANARPSDWLQQTLREFSRNYVEQSDRAFQRAEQGLLDLVVARLFPSPQWKVLERLERRRDQSAGVLLEGSFNSTAKRYPDRRVLVRLARDTEQSKGGPDADVVFDVSLERHLDMEDRERRDLPGGIEVRSDGVVRLRLNFFHRSSDEFYSDLKAQLQPVMSPWKVTPFMMLGLHQYLEEKREQHLIPKDMDREVELVFEPLLFDHALEELLSAELGQGLNAARERIVEQAFRRACELRFPTYRTLMLQKGWQLALKDYYLALDHLQSREEKQGKEGYEGTKRDVAELFHRTNTGLDSFISTFPDLIHEEVPFRGQGVGTVKFTLHPLETQFMELMAGGEPRRVRHLGQELEVHVLPIRRLYEVAYAQGYRSAEIDAVIDLLERRELAETVSGRTEIQEVPTAEVPLNVLREQIEAHLERLNPLLAAYPDDLMLRSQAENTRKMQRQLRERPEQLDAAVIHRLRSTLRQYGKRLDEFMEARAAELREEIRALAELRLPDPVANYKLSEPVPREFFGPHLETARKQLLAEAERLRSEQSDLRNAALDALAELRGELGPAQLREGLERSRNLSKVATQLRANANATETQCIQLVRARRALGRLSALSREVERLNEDTAPLTALGARISGELSSRKLAALVSSQSWEGEVERLESMVHESQVAKQQAFDQLKQRYAELLHEYLKRPLDLAFSAEYNPASPASSTELLTREVSEDILRTITRVREQLERWMERLRQILVSPDLAYVAGSHTGLRGDTEALLVEVEAVSRELDELRGRAADRSVIADASESGALVCLLNRLSGPLTSLPPFKTGFDVIDRAVGEVQLTSSETQLLEALQGIQMDGDSVDLGQLLQAVRSASGSEGVWHDLEGLYGKGWVAVYVKVRESRSGG